MKVIPLARSRHGEAKDKERDSETWSREISAFPSDVRHVAANLAAHSWDVTVVGDRLLISCAWYSPTSQGFHDRNGVFTPLTKGEMDQLYPPRENRYDGKSTRESGRWRTYTIETGHFV